MKATMKAGERCERHSMALQAWRNRGGMLAFALHAGSACRALHAQLPSYPPGQLGECSTAGPDRGRQAGGPRPAAAPLPPPPPFSP